MSDPTEIKARSVLAEGVQVDSVELKGIEVRLSGVKDATQRSRFVFLVMTLVAATILTSLWNSMLAWDREMAFHGTTPLPAVVEGQQTEETNVTSKIPDSRVSENQHTVSTNDKSKIPDARVSENQKTVATEWLKNLNVSIGLLGIRVGTNDLAVIGSISLIVVMLWFYFSQRRENRAIVGLLRYCKEGYDNKHLNKPVCNMVFEGIVQNILFIDMGGGDEPIEGLEPVNLKAKRNSFIRLILKLLVYLAPFTILMIILADIYSLLIPSYLRESDQPLGKFLIDGRHYVAMTKIVGFELIAIWACRYTWLLCRKCRKFSEATAKTIKEYNAVRLTL